MFLSPFNPALGICKISTREVIVEPVVLRKPKVMDIHGHGAGSCHWVLQSRVPQLQHLHRLKISILSTQVDKLRIVILMFRFLVQTVISYYLVVFLVILKSFRGRFLERLDLDSTQSGASGRRETTSAGVSTKKISYNRKKERLTRYVTRLRLGSKPKTNQQPLK